ncbi:MAG: hypothetical protein RSF00_07605 [Oscillospiraceae bacterium]
MKCEKSDIANEKDNVEVNFQMQFDLGTGNIIGLKPKLFIKTQRKMWDMRVMERKMPIA